MANNIHTEVLECCPVCGSSQAKQLERPSVTIGDEFFCDLSDSLRLNRCKSCLLEYVNPRPSPNTLMAFYNHSGYGAHTKQGTEQYVEASYRARYDLLSSVLKTPSTLLDFGCGGGAFVNYIHNKGWASYGVEPSLHGRDNATSLGVTVYSELSGTINADDPDIITAVHVIEHVPDLDATLSAFHGRLRPGGFLYVEVPNLGSLRARLIGMGMSPAADDARYRSFPIHLYGFRHSPLSLLLAKHGFKIVVSSSIGLGVDQLRVIKNLKRKNKQDLPIKMTSKSASSSVTESVKPETGRPRHSFLRNLYLSSRLGESLALLVQKQ